MLAEQLAAMGQKQFKAHCSTLPAQTAAAHKKMRRMEKNRASATLSSANKMARWAEQVKENAALKAAVARLEASRAATRTSNNDLQMRLAMATNASRRVAAAARCRQLLDNHAAGRHRNTVGFAHAEATGGPYVFFRQ